VRESPDECGTTFAASLDFVGWVTKKRDTRSQRAVELQPESKDAFEAANHLVLAQVYAMDRRKKIRPSNLSNIPLPPPTASPFPLETRSHMGSAPERSAFFKV